MPATAPELSKIFGNLFGTNAQANLVKLRDALQQYHRQDAEGSRKAADKVLTDLNNGEDPNFTEVQLRTLKKLFAWCELDSVSPLKLGENIADAGLVEFYRVALTEPFQDIQDLQTALYEAVVYNSQDNVVEAKNRLRGIAPHVKWTDEKIAVLEILLVRDQTFRSLAPYPVDVSCW